MFASRLARICVLAVMTIAVLAACQSTAPAPPASAPVTAATAAPGAAPTDAPSAAATTAPTAAGSASDEPVTVELWFNASEKNDVAAYQKGVDAFNASQNHIQLKLVTEKGDDAFLTAVSGNKAPDIYLTWDAVEPLGTWAHNGLVMPLDDYIKQDNYDLSAFNTVGVTLCQADGKNYGLPWQADQILFFWNMDHFREAGLDPDKPPKTLEEVYALAPKLTKTDANGNITRIGFLPPNGRAKWMAWLAQWGPSLYDAANQKITADDPRMIAALAELQKAWQIYGDPGKIDKFTASLGNALSPDDPFLKGQISMMLDGDWRLGYEVRYTDNKYGVDYGASAIPVPAGVNDRAGADYYFGMCMVIPHNSPHPKEAWEAIKFLHKYETDVLISNNMWNLPFNKKALDDPTLQAMPGFSVTLDNLKNNQDKMWVLPVTPVTSQLNDALRAQLDLVAHNKTTPEQAAQAINEAVQQELDQVLGR